MAETEWLFSEIRRQFGNEPLRSDVCDWLINHQWEIMQHMFPGCDELLCSVSDDTYDAIVDDLVKGRYDDGLAYQLIDCEFCIREDEEEDE